MFTQIWQSPWWLTFLCFVLIAGYIPLNRWLKIGHHWKSRFDDQIPLMPWFVFPYIFLYLLWMIGVYGQLYLRPLTEVQQMFTTTLLATGIGYAFFFFLPTYVETTYPTGTGIAIRLLQWLYVTDQPFNACPSMHVFITTLLMLFSWQWWPEYGTLWLALAVVISASTILTKRHYVLDVLGGVLVGLVSYLLVM